MSATQVSELRQAAEAVLAAEAAYRDAINGRAHKGEPHDQFLAPPRDPRALISTVDEVADCVACAGMQYGTESALSIAYGDLRVALGGERRPWE